MAANGIKSDHVMALKPENNPVLKIYRKSPKPAPPAL